MGETSGVEAAGIGGAKVPAPGEKNPPPLVRDNGAGGAKGWGREKNKIGQWEGSLRAFQGDE